MPDKVKKIFNAILGCVILVVLIQTLYRIIFDALPKNINSNPSPEYLSTMNFFEPNSLTVVVIVIFGLGTLYLIIFESE
jgi:hypothetical protein